MKPETNKKTASTWPAINHNTHRAAAVLVSRGRSGRAEDLRTTECLATPRGPTISRVKERRVCLSAALFVNIYVIVAAQMKP